MKENMKLIRKKQGRNVVAVLGVLSAGILLAGCTVEQQQPVNDKTQSTETPVSEEAETGKTESTETHEKEELPEETVSELTKKTYEAGELPEETLREILELFENDLRSSETVWYLQALTSYYRTPEEMNLLQFFWNGTEEGENIPLTDEEIVYASKELDVPERGITRAFPNEMNDRLMTYFGISLSEANLESIPEKFYYEPTDSYLFTTTYSSFSTYPEHNISELSSVEVSEARRLENGDVELVYTYYSNIKSVITMYQQEGVWKIKSNMPMNYDGTVTDFSFKNIDVGAHAIESIGNYGDMYYCSVGGTLTAFNRLDGSIIWENEDLVVVWGEYAFGDDGTLYFSSDFFAAVDKNGNVLTEIEEFEPGYRYGVSIECFDKYVEVRVCSDFDAWLDGYTEATEETTALFRVNLDDYSYEKVE